MSRKLLIVDDTNFARLRLKKLLEETNYEVIGEAGDGEEALRMLKDINPDIITLDMNMPVMDGMTFIKKFRSVNKKTKIIVMSAVGHDIAVTRAIEEGADGFLKKPFQQPELLLALSKLYI